MHTKARRAYEKPHVQRFGTFRDITNEGFVSGMPGALALASDGSAELTSELTRLRDSR